MPRDSLRNAIVIMATIQLASVIYGIYSLNNIREEMVGLQMLEERVVRLEQPVTLETAEQARVICLGIPRSNIAGNNVKNYIACMTSRGEVPNETDINALK